MEHYNMSNQEQITAFKKWLREYGVPILLAILLGIGGGYGVRYYRHVKLLKAENASTLYQTTLMQLQLKKNKAAIADAKQVVKKYPSSPYATLSNLLLAKFAVDQQQYDQAGGYLQLVMAKAKSKGLQQIARLRMARILLQQSQPKQALSILKVIDDSAFLPMIDERKGDAYAAMGQRSQAQQYYQQAKLKFAAMGLSDALLQLKM
jgi:predicted negative regulator of RcsB-dependent stress response